MTRMRLAVALALGLSIAAIHPASAQSVSKPPVPSIAIVDVEAVMRDSLAVKSARSQIDVIAKDLQQDIAQEEEKLRSEEQSLQQQRALLSPEKYAEDRQALQQRAAALQQRAMGASRARGRAAASRVPRLREGRGGGAPRSREGRGVSD